jgi:hypothetical protein
MRGSIPLFPRYTFVAWCSVKARGQLCLYLGHICSATVGEICYTPAVLNGALTRALNKKRRSINCYKASSCGAWKMQDVLPDSDRVSKNPASFHEDD